MKSRTDADSRVATAPIGGGDHRILGELGGVDGGPRVTVLTWASKKCAPLIARPRTSRYRIEWAEHAPPAMWRAAPSSRDRAAAPLVLQLRRQRSREYARACVAHV